MNPNAQTLDPKLKETYDRVMGSQFTPQPGPKSTPVQPSASVPVSHSPMPASPAPAPAAEHAGPAPVSQVFVASPTASSSKAAVVKNSGGKKISPLIIVALGIVFFAVYAVVWLKLFAIF